VLFAGLPDPGNPGFPAVVSILMGFSATSYGFWLGLPRDEVQWAGFLGAYIGVGLGLIVYLLKLIVPL
jgi:hypothetical protein